MMKSIRTLVRQDREKYVIPRRVQDVIPIQKIWEDGIFLTGGRYAKSFRFTDINYQVASEPDKEKMFRGYSAIINSLDCGATTKITIFNHRMSQINFEKSILMPMQWDGLDDYREEYNQMLLDKATNGNGIVQEKFITISVRKKDVDAARSFFARVEADLSAHFSALGSTCGPMNAMERLQILHRFYRKGEENEFRFSLRDSARKGHSFRDYICPDSMERHSDYLQIGKRYARVAVQHLPELELCPYSESTSLDYGCLASARTLRRTGTKIASSVVADNLQSVFCFSSSQRNRGCLFCSNVFSMH